MNTLSIFLQIISYLADNREGIKILVKNIENLIPEAPGNTKAAAVRGAIGTALGIETQIESIWPMVAPIFNLFVSGVKGPKPT